MKNLFTAIFTFISTTLVYSQKIDSLIIKKISDNVLVKGTAYENLRVLTKTVGGRLSGSPQMVKAEEWGFQALKAAGADTVYYQECMVPRWVRGGEDEAVATIGSKKNLYVLDVVALGNSLGTGKDGLMADVIEVKSFEELDAKKDMIKGKIVFYNYPFNDTYIRTFVAYGDASKYRSQGASRAAKYGAVGVIVRSMTNSSDNHPHTGGLNYEEGVAKIPAVAVGLKDSDWLSKSLESEKVTINMKTYGHFLPDVVGRNVIGEIRGSEFPNEFITVGGHLDSWDNNEGAHDDGAGCVQSIEILRAFKAIGHPPKRTLRIVLFANEENGTRGGNKYAEVAKNLNEKHMFALESDAGGFTPRGFSLSMSQELIDKVQSWKSLFLPYGVYEFNRGGGGVDITPLNKALGTPMAGLVPDSQRYFDYHHARSDVFENVNKRELLLGAINMAALIYLVDKYGL